MRLWQGLIPGAFIVYLYVRTRFIKKIVPTTVFVNAGKTTLLNILAGRLLAGKVSGSVKMNNEPCTDIFRRISAYVPQEDSFVATMSAQV